MTRCVPGSESNQASCSWRAASKLLALPATAPAAEAVAGPTPSTAAAAASREKNDRLSMRRLSHAGPLLQGKCHRHLDLHRDRLAVFRPGLELPLPHGVDGALVQA